MCVSGVKLENDSLKVACKVRLEEQSVENSPVLAKNFLTQLDQAEK